VTPPELSLSERLNRSCYCSTADVPALQRWLERDLAGRGLTQPIVATHPHLFSESPVFVGSDHLAAATRIIDAVERVVALPAYREHVLAEAPELARKPPGALGALLSYDFHVADTGPKLIEINTNAGGILLAAALRRAQRVCCIEVEELLRVNRRAQSHSDEHLERALLEMFAREWRLAARRAPLGSVVIVDDRPQEQYLYPEFLLFERLLASHGIAASIASPEELRFEGGALRHGERRIDLLYNRLTDFYLTDPAHRVVRDAYLADAAVVTPHPHAHALYANKRNLAVLTDERTLRSLGVSADEVAVLAAGIPQTVAVVPDAADRWWADRKAWFFKPAAGYGSRGSYRGDKLTRGVFAEIVKGGYVAQRLVPPTERRVSEQEDKRPLKIDLRVYVYAGHTLTVAARLYQGQTTNFRTPGGGFAPVYVIPGETTQPHAR
jgi:hypothetical protein